MQDKNKINKSRALYYNLFANFFILSKDTHNYFELISLVNLFKSNSLDSSSQIAMEKLSKLLDPLSNIKLIEEFDNLFHSPLSKNIRQTASFYDEGVESGKKRVEMIQFLAKTKIRRNEKLYFEYEDSVGFIFSLMANLVDLVSKDESEYENTVHCIFSEILNNFIDEFAKDIYEHNDSVIYKELMIILHSFIEFERLYLEVSKPNKKDQIQEQKPIEIISDAEKERRFKNKQLKQLDNENIKHDIAYDIEDEV